MNKKDLVILFFLIIGVAFLRLPSLFEPAWHRDEGITLVLGNAIHNGEVLYRDIADNKTPLLYFLASIFPSVFGLKMMLFVWQIIFIIVFFLLSNKISGKTGALISSIIALIFFNTPLFEGNIANGEIFFILPLILGFSTFVLGIYKKKTIYFLLCGFFYALGMLFKQAAIFDFIALILGFFLFFRDGKKLLYVFLGFIIPVLTLLLYFIYLGNLTDFWEYAFLWNFSYSSYNNYFIVPYGIFLIKFLLLFFSLILFFCLRKRLDKITLVLLVWLVFSFLGSTLSLRGYIHYFIPVLVPLSLLLGKAFVFNKKYFIILLMFFVSASVGMKFINYPYTYVYYKNYWDYKMRFKNLIAYRNFFDQTTERNYLIADYMRKKAPGTIFVWGDEPFFYLLTGRSPLVKFPVAYNINFTKGRKEEAATAFIKNPPKYILIVSPVKFKFPELFNLVSKLYTLSDKIEGVSIYERKI